MLDIKNNDKGANMNTTEATTNPHTDDEIVVSDEVVEADRIATPDVVAVAILSDGTQQVLDAQALGSVRSDDMHVWGTVAVSLGYVYEDGTWEESERLVRHYWTETDAVGNEAQYATGLA